MDRAVVVVAAGSGTRLGIGTAKAFVPVAGALMLARALEPLFALPSPTLVVVVAPASHLDECRQVVGSVAGAAVAYTAVVPGGADRHGSVEAGLAVLPDSVTTVLVHDAARCLTPAAQFSRVFDAVAAGDGAGVVPALPVTDTVKRVDGDVVVETVDRAALVGVQTPQGFPLAALRRAYAVSSQSETDDAGVFQAVGGTVRFVPGDADAFKITTPWDLGRAESIVRARTGAGAGAGAAGANPADAVVAVRLGLGVDVHAFDDASPCRVGLLDFPGEPGLSGHSDGDAVAHAVCDALLSAGGLGDIGGRFGTADPQYAGATGDVFVRGAVALLADAGLVPVSVTVQVIGNRPRIGRRRDEMQDALSAVVGAPVAVSGTTTDGLGFTGRGEGLAAIATALVRPS
ncbi:2-C-methyl-D-erythritol 4-phosphate cytidylyltransferase [Curtobacterium flaccumfaciens pv. flaccumfaciens]|uniref:2-C-methyl-D-erythritol 4-phosphate cytidylyltransferase n=1 Tax=Curtobacterium flaccumfaciens TaxID=2035 RepID=UPI00217CF8CF|nr:2-C-methyl-D-erythritol 4-phosphate cytidylyltransferase [Curtobacterium flaccumfaciens]MCS6569429.1 2-C-methyl-D-erythritol 4-phosphate cytidylyltransferase [Curtobacterium flaccumfaciens pv. flaccumfaciens]MCS6583721.1 2-C-methyl-D-erythritol 4-phosphate cytidylyltransferase [Curtobacterium flaccumfaciens pv. flaccumfaciens]